MGTPNLTKSKIGYNIAKIYKGSFMKRIVTSALLAAQLVSFGYAGGGFEEVEPVVNETAETEEERFEYYVVVKAMTILGDNISEEHALLDGDRGYGFGIDFGYRVGEGFAIECDYSYASNDVTEHRAEEGGEVLDYSYRSLALDVVYSYEVTEKLGIFAKAGFEYEWENVDETDEDNYETGAVFGIGLEYGFGPRYRFVAEYEHSTIDGPRGDSVFAGVMYNF